ncbi:hypothetical protein [Dyella sp. EPa41]|uniref:hypothetical protein n=1 Tax=Dyella sp. EPa41 TaxID=1561194 RepID=UPI001916367B|nr:hypothetical protein [Dyella sp. EPa41]
MRAFFENVDPRAATAISDVSRRMFDLRERCKRLLGETGCGEADEILAAVREGSLPEHPGYDAWLAARLLGDRERALQATLQWRCLIANGGKRLPPPRSGLAALAYAMRPMLPPVFAGGMRLHPDAISFSGESGIQVLVRALTPQAWSFEWHWAGEAWRLDTAPVTHPGVDSVAHVHRPDGSVVANPISLPLMGETPAVVLAFLQALAHSPTLGLD